MLSRRVGLILVGLLAFGRAGPSPGQDSASGHVLLLQNERVLEGNIERQGLQYRVRRVVGEMYVPAEQVLALCCDMADAYQALRQHASLGDADERLRLARWCHVHGLRTQALEEAKAALVIRPDLDEAARLVSALDKPISAAKPKSASARRAESADAPGPEVTAQSLTMFRNRVQPVLMNACASCHVGARGGSFRLERTFGDGLDDRTTGKNLRASLAQLKATEPDQSPLLVRSVVMHGGSPRPPLKGRDAPAYRVLQDWVRLTCRDGVVGAPAMSAISASPAVKSDKTVVPAKSSGFGEESAPGTKVPISDPFDPDIFNRAVHGADSPAKPPR